MVQPLWKQVWWFIKLLNMEFLHDPVISLLDLYPRELKSYVHTQSAHEFPNSIILRAKKWKQPTSSEEWIKKKVACPCSGTLHGHTKE